MSTEPDLATIFGLSVPTSLKRRLDAMVARTQRARSNLTQQAIIELLDRMDVPPQRGPRK